MKNIVNNGCCCSVPQSCLTLCDLMDCSMPSCPVLHYLQEFAQTHVHWVHDAVQPSHPLSSPSPPVFNLSQNQGLFQWVGSSHQKAKVLELLLQIHSFQWIFRIQDWFPLELTGLISLLFKGLSSLLKHHSLKASILRCSAFFMVQLSHLCMTTRKAHYTVSLDNVNNGKNNNTLYNVHSSNL